MVEKIMVSPQSVRGYGNVADVKETDDYGGFRCTLEGDTDVINGVEERIFSIEATPAPLLSISSLTSDPVGGRCVRVSASFKDTDNNSLAGKTISLKKGEDILGTIVTNSGSNVFQVVLPSGENQVYGSFEGDDDYLPAVSESVSIVPAKAPWDVEYEFDEEEYSVGDDVVLSGTVGTVYDEIVDGEVVTGRSLEPNVRVMLYTGSQTSYTNTSSSGAFEFHVSNLQTNSFRIVISSNASHRVLNQLVDVPVHNYRLVISKSEKSAIDNTVLAVGLTDFNSEVEWATVAVAGSDGSSYTCVTDSMGEATVDVGFLAAETTFTASYGNVSASVTVEPNFNWYDAANYTAGSGRMPLARESSIYLQAVGGRWLNKEFTNKDSYVLEFDLILSKSNREGFYFGANPNSNTNSGISIFRDISNTLIETFDSTGTAIRLESSLPGSYYNTGTHHIRIERDYDVAYIYFDENMIFEFNEEVLSYGAEDRMYNTVGILSWGSGYMEFGNFELSD